MAGLDPAIHEKKPVDPRVEPGDDGADVLKDTCFDLARPGPYTCTMFARYRLEGASIGAQLRRPAIRQSSSSPFLRNAVTRK